MKRRERLTKEQLTELQRAVKNKENDSIEIRRMQAVLLINNESEELIITSITGFTKKYAFKLRTRYQNKGLPGIATKKRKERSILTKQQLQDVIETLKTKPPKECDINADFWTTSILAEYIKRTYNVVYKSKTSFYLLFKKAGFTYHKPEKVYHQRKQELIDEWNKTTAPIVQQALDNPNTVVLAGDEMILTTQTTTQKVWLLSGTYSHVEVANKRDKRCIYGFLNVKTGQEHAFKTDYTNSLTTCDMLRKLDALYPDKLITLVWDNASWHKSKVVRQFLEEHPNRFHLIAFPPYAPEENPQEHVWKAGRTYVTHNKFIEDIDAASDEFVQFLESTKFNYKILQNLVSN